MKVVFDSELWLWDARRADNWTRLGNWRGVADAAKNV
jgi:hypothetical protein